MSKVSLPLPLSHFLTFSLCLCGLQNQFVFGGLLPGYLHRGINGLSRKSLLVSLFNVDSGVHCSVKSVCTSCLT